MVRPTGNMFEALVAISKRANQISNQLKRELHTKLEEFSVTSDTIEEIHENKEQIEISKFYERLPNPAIIATEEYLHGELAIKYRDEEQG
ncbi:MAG: DNA-directed RNA polymerase subunit omega [Saprospiraceae bacterium]|nr:DNA-directed RNA polymerase subunit omega [Saprospiraceae bacterium]